MINSDHYIVSESSTVNHYDRSSSVAVSASIAGSSISSIVSRSSPQIAHLPQTVPTVVVGQNRSPTVIDSHAIDPYVHTMQKLSEVGGIGRQQRCVTCNAEGRHKTQTSVYCGLCTITANRDADRKPTKHAYCLNPKYQCFSRHIAACYMHMNRTGELATRTMLRKKAKTEIAQVNLPIAGSVLVSGIPRRRRTNRRKRNTTSNNDGDDSSKRTRKST